MSPRRGDTRGGAPHQLRSLVARRCAFGVVALVVVSVVIFAATLMLPGNAAYAILGQSASPAKVAALEEQLRLDEGHVQQYLHWASGLLHGDMGTSLVNGRGVWDQVAPRLENSIVLVLLAGVIGSAIGILLGALAALWRDGKFDHVTSTVTLALTSLPEFVVAVGLIMLLATNVLQLFPAVSVIPPGTSPLAVPDLLVLPVATLVVVTVPYILRMTRAAMIEALESDYAEMALLKGASKRRIVFLHALPNALPPIVQVVGLTFIYLAGGVVIVESVFNLPGIGQGLVSAVANRDVPVIQFIVLVLAVFYIVTNIATDVVAMAASPRRRTAR